MAMNNKMEFANIFRMDETNVGDWYSSPNRYFSIGYECTDIWQLNIHHKPKSKNVIYGGGGLIGQMRPLAPLTYLLKEDNYKQFGWGIGDHSFVCMDEQTQYMPPLNITYPTYILEWDLLGIRDYYPELYKAHNQISWVPCASCMDSGFDKEYEIKHDFVFYNHGDLPFHIILGIRIPNPKEYPERFMSNKSDNIEDVLKFLGSGETIVTNSYHGVYWGTLLKRKVICIPYSSKFWGFKHKPQYTLPLLWQEVIKDTKIYTDALEECREANINYYKLLCERVGNE